MTSFDLRIWIERLIDKHITSFEDEQLTERIYQAMRVVDRQWFVEDTKQAYADTALPLRTGQTISQPSTVAFMLFTLAPQRGESVLEVGAGSGWQAALLTHIVSPGIVHSIDVTEEQVELARANLEKAKEEMTEQEAMPLQHMSIKIENFYEHTSPQTYDRIIITAGMSRKDHQAVLAKAEELLAEGGRMVCPYHHGPLLIVEKHKEELSTSHTKEEFAFVPLIHHSQDF